MELEPNHPFEVLILEDTPSDGNKSFAINSGKIINFHNPLNYRNVKCDSGGAFLPILPYSIKNPDTNEEEESIIETSFSIDSQDIKIEIYLFCSFKPPERWVSGPHYIPMIDESWIVLKTYSDPNDSTKFALKGKIKNPSEDNIKLHYYDINKTQTDEDKETGLYEEQIDWVDNAVNLGPIALLQKKENIWTIKQFLKENYIFCDFFDSKVFEKCNTDLFNLNQKTVIKQSEKELNAKLSSQKETVSDYINYPSFEEFKGHIKYKGFQSRNDFQLKFPYQLSHLEVIQSFNDSHFNF